MDLLHPRLKGVESAEGKNEAVVTMETNIKELEVWLLSCSKFDDNCGILLQADT